MNEERERRKREDAALCESQAAAERERQAKLEDSEPPNTEDMPAEVPVTAESGGVGVRAHHYQPPAPSTHMSPRGRPHFGIFPYKILSL